MKNNHLFPLFIYGMFIFTSWSCQNSVDKYVYTEINIKRAEAEISDFDPHAGLPGFNTKMGVNREEGEVSSSSSPIHWVVPEGWTQKPGSGMRLASFTAGEGEESIDCSLVVLGGMAGGLEANVKRWLGQLGIEGSDTTIRSFLSTQEILSTTENLDVTFVDLTEWKAEEAQSDSSMMVAVINIGEKTIFLKMTGKSSALKSQKDNFKLLSKSIALTK